MNGAIAAAGGPPSVFSYSFGAWLAHWRDALIWDPLATFTVVLAASTILLWWTTRRMWKSADEQARIAARAYLGLDVCNVIVTNPAGELIKLDLDFVWRNQGNTPARAVAACAGGTGGDGPLPPDFTFDQDNPPGDTRSIAAGQSTTVRTTIKRDMIVDPNVRIYIFSSIEYNDVFIGTARLRTEACFEVIFDGGRVAPTNIKLSVHGRFNGHDGDCMFPPRQIVGR